MLIQSSLALILCYAQAQIIIISNTCTHYLLLQVGPKLHPCRSHTAAVICRSWHYQPVLSTWLAKKEPQMSVPPNFCCQVDTCIIRIPHHLSTWDTQEYNISLNSFPLASRDGNSITLPQASHPFQCQWLGFCADHATLSKQNNAAMHIFLASQTWMQRHLLVQIFFLSPSPLRPLLIPFRACNALSAAVFNPGG